MRAIGRGGRRSKTHLGELGKERGEVAEMRQQQWEPTCAIAQRGRVGDKNGGHRARQDI